MQLNADLLSVTFLQSLWLRMFKSGHVS